MFIHHKGRKKNDTVNQHRRKTTKLNLTKSTLYVAAVHVVIFLGQLSFFYLFLTFSYWHTIRFISESGNWFV